MIWRLVSRKCLKPLRSTVKPEAPSSTAPDATATGAHAAASEADVDADATSPTRQPRATQGRTRAFLRDNEVFSCKAIGKSRRAGVAILAGTEVAQRSLPFFPSPRNSIS